MINGMHALIYSTDPGADRAFLRDGLGWSFVEDHPGWLIFRLPPAEIAVHPLDAGEQPSHELFLMCDDLHATVPVRAPASDRGRHHLVTWRNRNRVTRHTLSFGNDSDRLALSVMDDAREDVR